MVKRGITIKENSKLSNITWYGESWKVNVKSIDKDNKSDIINFTYLGALKDLQSIKQISFAVGSEEMTQIITVFDISKPDQNEAYEGEYKAKGIQFLDFKNLQTTNIEIKFNVLSSAGELDYLFQNKYLIMICWSDSFDGGLEKKDTISIN